jgi:hypothetical protein
MRRSKRKHGKRVLFILKKRQIYGYPTPEVSQTGLYQSALFCVIELAKAGIHADLTVVNDNNDIDRVVSAFRPTHVIVEALWVVPDKFDQLQYLHPKVQWIVRLHSKLPFLAMEGIALEWIWGYLKRGVLVSGNSKRLDSDLREIATCVGSESLIVYLPNCYGNFTECSPVSDEHRGTLRVACLGAVRPLKNQLIQAVAASTFARQRGLHLEFHMNTGRIEGGDPMLRNIEALFSQVNCGALIEHPWLPRPQYLDLIAQMDVGMQVSLSETFNMVTADTVSRHIPVVVSPEIEWMPDAFKADPINTDSIVRALGKAVDQGRWGAWRNMRALQRYAADSAALWINHFKNGPVEGGSLPVPDVPQAP